MIEIKCEQKFDKMVAVSTLVFDEFNLREFPIVERHVASVKLSLEMTKNLIFPIVLDAKDEVIDGKHRVLAFRELGIKQIPCVFFKGSVDEVEDFIVTTEFSQKDKTPAVRGCRAVKEIEKADGVVKTQVHAALLFEVSVNTIRECSKIKSLSEKWFAVISKGGVYKSSEGHYLRSLKKVIVDLKFVAGIKSLVKRDVEYTSIDLIEAQAVKKQNLLNIFSEELGVMLEKNPFETETLSGLLLKQAVKEFSETDEPEINSELNKEVFEKLENTVLKELLSAIEKQIVKNNKIELSEKLK